MSQEIMANSGSMIGIKTLSPPMSTDEIHALRKSIDANIQTVNEMSKERSGKGMRELAIVKTKLQEAKMWAGKILEELGSELPEQFRDKA